MNIIWNPEKRKVKDLIHWEDNPRKITPESFEKLKSRILERGFHDIIKIDRKNTIISGNMRTEALLSLGIEEVNVLVPNRDLTIKEMVVIALESNRNDGEDDLDKLQNFDVENLKEAGFPAEQISELFDFSEPEPEEFDEEEELEKAKKHTTVKTGEIYQIGENRLMCGDSTDPEQVQKLMGGVRANVVYCDPPYNIGLDYSSGMHKGKKYQGSYEDKRPDSDYEGFIEKTMLNALANSEKAVHFYYWCDERYIGMIQRLYEKLGIENKRVCVWIKNGQMPTPQLAFNKAYEPCVYGTIGRPFLNKNFTGFNEVINPEIGNGNRMIEDILELINVWVEKRDNLTEYEHPTQKPVKLHSKPLKRCSKPGDVVLDLFGGSGSTLISCEWLKRRAFLMERDPIFAQVILNRWEYRTGEKAVKVAL